MDRRAYLDDISRRTIGCAHRVSNCLGSGFLEKVLVELKAAKNLTDLHAAQCMNYPKATQLSVCLLINFGEARVSVRRIVRDF